MNKELGVDRIHFRAATEADIDTLLMFTLDHGANQWNHLPPLEVKEHFEQIVSGNVSALLAFDGDTLIALISFFQGRFFPQYDTGTNDLALAYIAEVVVHRNYVGRGLGTKLVGKVCDVLFEKEVKKIYALRHEENLPSTGIFNKCGFEIIDTFYDPERRPSGSRRSSIVLKRAPNYTQNA